MKDIIKFLAYQLSPLQSLKSGRVISRQEKYLNDVGILVPEIDQKGPAIEDDARGPSDLKSDNVKGKRSHFRT